MQRWYIYGNYIDEVLRMSDSSSNDYYYLHDHLYSPAVLVEDNGTVVERYEYETYANPVKNITKNSPKIRLNLWSPIPGCCG